MPRRSFLYAVLGLGAALAAGRARAASFLCEAPEGAAGRRVERALAAAARERVEALPPLGVAAQGITVSGLSSGAAMAMQLHLAHSARVSGAGILAGTAYGCALSDGFWNYNWANAQRAQSRCMEGRPEPVPVDALAARIRALAAAARIDPLSGLEGARVWLLTSRNDRTVLEPAMRAVEALYRQLVGARASVLLRNDLPAGHGWPTQQADSDPADALDECAATAPPYLNACRSSATAEMLQFLLQRAPVAAAAGRLLKFDQRPLRGGSKAMTGLADAGYVCLPRAVDGDTRLHVALHGCCQSLDRLGNLFALETGFAQLAGAFNLVVLLPQTAATPFNPKGCWDWWGYTEPFNFGAAAAFDFPTRCAPQIRAIMRMVARLAGDTTLVASRC